MNQCDVTDYSTGPPPLWPLPIGYVPSKHPLPNPNNWLEENVDGIALIRRIIYFNTKQSYVHSCQVLCCTWTSIFFYSTQWMRLLLRSKPKARANGRHLTMWVCACSLWILCTGSLFARPCTFGSRTSFQVPRMMSYVSSVQIKGLRATYNVYCNVRSLKTIRSNRYVYSLKLVVGVCVWKNV